ncbi:hypothetical protein C5U62_18575 [Pseudomonas protegens]|uniref:Uncharacterized protein n=1 Tax=Pseudomonas protegens TaxID=380021 RepID=A0A2T6GIJ9_9PSED|nr:hypothetical protein C5U62_18575 [Pseudomonas protegens]
MARELAPVGPAGAPGRSSPIFGGAARPSGSKLPRHKSRPPKIPTTRVQLHHLVPQRFSP